MIKADALTPASASEYLDRLRDAFRELDRADAALACAWDERNDARWRHSTCLKDMLPVDHPAVLAAEAKIEEARVAWRAAQATYVAAVRAPLALVCNVSDWRQGKLATRARCRMPADHCGSHDFETTTAELAEAEPAWMTEGKH